MSVTSSRSRILCSVPAPRQTTSPIWVTAASAPKITARFRLANWGTQFTDTNADSWKTLPAADAVPYQGASGVFTSPEFRFTWPTVRDTFTTDFIAAVKAYQASGGATGRADHQCIFVEITTSDPSVVLTQSSAFNNLFPRNASTFQETAEVSVVGNPPIGGSSASPPLLPSPVFASYYQIVQTDAYVMIFSEMFHDVRVVRMNGEHLPSTIKRWLGDSIGRWEGRTLVIDTTNFRADTHNADSSDHLHVVERFTRVDENTLRYRVTIDDPETWTRPWTAEWPFKASDNKLFEDACHEGNYAIENALRGARADEQRQGASK